MGLAGAPTATQRDSESAQLLPPPPAKVPEDKFHLAYIMHFTLGLGFLLPWNTFITAVDYFDDIYPGVSVDRIFAVAYFAVGLACLLAIVFYAQRRSGAYVRINLGLSVFVVALLVVPVMDAFYVRGRVGMYGGFWVTVGALGLSGLGDALVQGGLVGAAGELPERYMQAIVAGTGCSGVLASVLRLLTKAVYSHDKSGLRKSANLYFSVGIVLMAVCVVFYNVAHRLPVIQYYADLKLQAVTEQNEEKGSVVSVHWRSTLGEVFGSIKWHGYGIVLIYLVTLAIFPGYITEDVHSDLLQDWYPILLITGYNVFDLVGKSLTAVYLLENANIAVGSCLARLLFFPLFFLCMHGPQIFRSEIPVTILTCLLGLTNGYLTSVLMILAPKAVPLHHSETAGIVTVLFLMIGLASGSFVAWFWVI